MHIFKASFKFKFLRFFLHIRKKFSQRFGNASAENVPLEKHANRGDTLCYRNVKVTMCYHLSIQIYL